jgi:hypothetical protein
MIRFNPLPTAPPEYSNQEESFFRRGVENALLDVYSRLEAATTAQSGEASPASKRETLLLDPNVGVDLISSAGYSLDTSNSATPNVVNVSNLVIFSSGSPLVITDFLGGFPGKEITVWSYQITGLTIQYSGLIGLLGNVDLVFPTAVTSRWSNVTLKYMAPDGWIEISRMIR